MHIQIENSVIEGSPLLGLYAKKHGIEVETLRKSAWSDLELEKSMRMAGIHLYMWYSFCVFATSVVVFTTCGFCYFLGFGSTRINQFCGVIALVSLVVLVSAVFIYFPRRIIRARARITELEAIIAKKSWARSLFDRLFREFCSIEMIPGRDLSAVLQGVNAEELRVAASVFLRIRAQQLKRIQQEVIEEKDSNKKGWIHLYSIRDGTHFHRSCHTLIEMGLVPDEPWHKYFR